MFFVIYQQICAAVFSMVNLSWGGSILGRRGGAAGAGGFGKAGVEGWEYRTLKLGKRAHTMIFLKELNMKVSPTNEGLLQAVAMLL